MWTPARLIAVGVLTIAVLAPRHAAAAPKAAAKDAEDPAVSVAGSDLAAEKPALPAAAERPAAAAGGRQTDGRLLG